MTENVFRLITRKEKVDSEKISNAEQLISWLSENMDDIESFVFLGTLKNGSPNFTQATSSKKELVFLGYIISKCIDMAVMQLSETE